MTITPMEKELAAVGISVATGCRPCTDFHVKAARKLGASDAEIKQAMSDAFAVRRGATGDHWSKAYGLAHLGERRPEANLTWSGPATRVRELHSAADADRNLAALIREGMASQVAH